MDFERLSEWDAHRLKANACAGEHFTPRPPRALTDEAGAAAAARAKIGRRRFRPELAQRLDHAMPAFRPARLAHITPMQDQPVMRVLQKLLGREFLQRKFDGAHILARREPRSVGNPKDVRIDGNGRVAERRVQHHVRRLASDARQAFERLAFGRHFAVVLIQQNAARRDHVLRLRAIQADGLDVVGDAFLAKIEHLLRRIRDGKHPAHRLVHGDVRCLRGQHHGDQQLERCRVFQFGRRMRVQALQRLVDRTSFGRIHAAKLGLFRLIDVLLGC